MHDRAPARPTPRPRAAWLALAAALALAPGALAEESDAEPAIGFPGTLGLTGMRDMVDARVPAVLSIRAGARYDVTVLEHKFRSAFRAARNQQSHEFTLYGGASALGLLDASVRLPFVYRRDGIEFDGQPSPRARYDQGWGDLDVAAKVAWGLGPVVLSPFAFGKLPSGEPDVGDFARFEYGVAATFDFLNRYLAVHANLAGVQAEEGRQAIRYRLGASAVVWADEGFVVRVYGYGDGIEYEGSIDSDFDVDFGVQALLGLLTFELGMSVRLVDTGQIDDALRGARSPADGVGIFERHITPAGHWSLVAGVGVMF